MFGCLRRLGCLAIVLLLAAAAWFTRDRWLHRFSRDRADASPTATVWEPLTPEGARRARASVEQLGRASGPVFANVRAGDLASYVFVSLADQLPPSAEHTQAAVIGERLYVKTLVKLSDFGGAQVLGPLGGFLPERDTVVFGGTFHVIEPGLAEYRIEELKVGRFAVPRQVVPRIVQRIRRGGAREKVSTNGLALAVPPAVGDVRVGQGKVTLYRTVR